MTAILTNIEAALNECNFKYTIEQNKRWYEYHLSSDLPYKLFIRCNTSSEFIRIHYWIGLDQAVVTDKWCRLLDFCNITSRGDFLNAKLYEDGVDISYSIPDGAGDALARLVINALYDYFKYIDHAMLDKALETGDDLYQYYEDKILKEHEDIKRRIANQGH